jgi:hypothetical protein
VAGVEGAVLRGLYHPSFWSESEVLPDRHRLALPADLAPGRYHLDLGLVRAGQVGSPLPVEGGDAITLDALLVGPESP